MLMRVVSLAIVLVVAACGGSRSTAPSTKNGAAVEPTPAKQADEYEALVQRAEAGEEVDFLRLRTAYLASPAFERGRAARDQIFALRKQIWAAMESGDDEGVLRAANETIAIVYIDLDAQKARYQACFALGRTGCDNFKRISLGLLKSLVSTGDGKSCETAWHVVSVDEEYFVLRMLGVESKGQALTETGGVCDRLDVTDENGDPGVLFFEVGALLDAQEKLLKL